MRSADLAKEGYRPIIEKKETPLSRLTKEFVYLAKTRDPRKRERLKELDDALERAIRQPDMAQELPDIETLKRQPNFETKGFESYPSEDYKWGEQPPTAPISKEQMQLLLSSTVPAEMLPFVVETCVFRYKPDNENESYTGPSAKIIHVGDQPKLEITLTNEHFRNKGVPPSAVTEKDRKQAELLLGTMDGKEVVPGSTKKLAQRIAQRRTNIIGFIDPAKVAFLVGSVLANSVLDLSPSKNNKDLEEWDEVVDEKFQPIPKKTNKKALRQKFDLRRFKKEERSKAKKDRRIQQWRDFVGLAFTAPDVAQRRWPEAYAFFQKKVAQFNDPTFSQKAIRNIEAAAFRQKGVIMLQDVAQMPDLRTEEEKMQDKGISPSLAGYERFIAGFNRFSAGVGRLPIIGRLPFAGLQITYTIPDMPESLAEDDKEAKRLVETLPDEKMRDEDFMAILSAAKDFDKKARQETFRYLLAASQNGDFAEWRVYAWLYKFSPTFRQWHGQYIGEEDYKALQILHDQSEKAGRIGTGVMSYEAVTVRTPETQYVGRRNGTFLYARKDRVKYLRQVESKVRDRSIQALTSAMDQTKYKSLNHLKKPNGGWFDLNEKFSDNSQTQTIDLMEAGGDKLGPELVQWLGDLGIDKVSPDARAVAIAYYEHYRNNDYKSDQYITAKVRDVISHYGESLNEPPTDMITDLLSEPAKRLAQLGDFEEINKRLESAQDAKGVIMRSLGAELRKPKYSEYLPEEVRQQILGLIYAGATDAGTINQALLPILRHLYNDGEGYHEDIIRHRMFMVMRFMYDGKTIENLVLLEKVKKYEKDLKPDLAVAIEQAADVITKLKPEELVGEKSLIKPQLSHQDLKKYEKIGITLTPADQDEVRNADKSLLGLAQAESTATAGQVTPEEAVNTDIENDSPAKNAARARILARKLIDPKTDPLVRRRFVVTALETSVGHLEKAIIYQDYGEMKELAKEPEVDGYGNVKKVHTTIYERFTERWLDAPDNQIFLKLPPLRKMLNTLALDASRASSHDPKLQAQALQQLSKDIAEIKKALKFEERSIEYQSKKKTASA